EATPQARDRCLEGVAGRLEPGQLDRDVRHAEAVRRRGQRLGGDERPVVDPPLVREGGYALYTLRAETGQTALAAAATITRTDSCVLSEATTAVTPGLRPSAASDRNARLRDGVLEGAHRRSRLGRTHARLRPLAEPAADACGPDGARCTRPHAEHASTHHGAGLDFDDVEPRPG